MNSLERVRNLVAGRLVDHLPAQPMLMMFAAKHADIPFIEYTRDGRKLAAAQLKAAADFEIDCLLTHIVNSGCEVSPLTPPDNLRALVQCAKDHQPGDAITTVCPSGNQPP